ncbi:MAG: GTPase HflX, partial [Betaproteobacteria bacterium]|nr:GTPase HflX [Betaproteobacteria bacterium]
MKDIAIARIEGNTQGLKSHQLKALQRLPKRRYPRHEAYTAEQAHELAGLSRSIGRQIGLLIDRLGKVELVLLGDANAIFIPELVRGRVGAERLRGVRLLHTHLNTEGLSQEDLMDLIFLRLDAVAVLTVDPEGQPARFQYAQLLPPNPRDDPYQVYPLVPWDRAIVDFTTEAEALETELARSQPGSREFASSQRALLVSVSALPRLIQERHMEELKELARTAGLHVVGELVQRVAKPNPKFILGKGKMAELEVLALRGHASIILFDGELSPSQLHNLTELTERKVLDRTQLILDIFAQHAVSSAGKLQVEMAQLQYIQPRLVGKNRAMDRLMGGIGGRGPGETKLETDRRRIRERIVRIRKELENLRSQRAFTRQRRSRQGISLAALVGYTNVGKSTLLNALTNADVLAEDKFFATLDPTTRRLRFPRERELILADTVGFIRGLPDELKDAFRATLEELESADLLLHVADASHPELPHQLEAVEDILHEMGIDGMPRLLILNKWDTVMPARRVELLTDYPQALPISSV